MAKEAIIIEEIVEEPEIEVIIEGIETDSDEETLEDASSELSVPEGGIGGFAMSDEDFAILEAEEAKKEFGEEGLGQFTAVAKKMAGYGRFGDDSVAHIQTGEIVVPLALIENNPLLKEQIFKQLRESGIEDPEQYVVGSEANSINPETGLMEFGFFSKLWKGIKKVVKAVVKVIKKVAPIILPIALAFTPLGPIYGAALGSGIGTLINGGSIKDALKSALISGAVGGVTAGFTGNTGSFTGNIGEAASGFGARVGQTAAGFTEGVTSGSLGGFKDSFFSSYVPTPGAQVDVAGNAAVDGVAVDGAVVETTAGVDGTVAGADGTSVVDVNAAVEGGTTLSGEITPLEKPPGFYESVKGALTPGDDIGFVEGMGDAFFPGKTTTSDVLTNQGINPVTATASQQAGAKLVAADLTPGILRRFGPLAAAGTVAGAAGGFFEVPDVENSPFLDYNNDGTVTTGEDLIAGDPGKYLVKDLGQSVLNEETGEYEPKAMDLAIMSDDMQGYQTPSQFPLQNNAMNQAGYLQSSTPGGPFARPYVTAAEGGPIFPRRSGGIAPTEGTPGQDSVRAMLMPGEFVMTTDAVKGLGQGNVNNGIQNMYTIMRNLESRGRATA
tara:strand:+ start:521 stop:2353 length:1833 start_codon:yes stop_codon:yes gene_type:complete